jgi:peptidoglycan/LPS O-acetylase OafA/YrhL
MRGIAIIFIVLHNLLHLILPTTENEFTFHLARSITFAKCALEFNPTLWKDIFSFLGWYGVAIFLFLSGYGLTLKYGFTTQQPFKAGTFVWKHLKRVFLLMILPYTWFAIRHLLRSQSLPVLMQITLTSNIFRPNGISPGVFWFFGLIAQFYIFFALIRKYSSTRSASTGGGYSIINQHIITNNAILST